MSVYVDNLRVPFPPSSSWQWLQVCHLWAEDEKELEIFAKRLGLRKNWRHGDHYDLTAAKRLKAIKLGAIEITQKQLVIMRKNCD